jgi:hypothetical protein
MTMADKATPPPPPPPIPGIGLPEIRYSGKEPLTIRLLEFLFGGKKKPR